MPDIQRLSDTQENDILLLSGGHWYPEARAAAGNRLPHEFTERITRSVNEQIEEFATVSHARVLEFNPDTIQPVVSVSWFQSALERLKDLANSEADWDGYGAPRVHPGAIVASLAFLHQVATRLGSRPAIVGTGGGNVQFEWRGNDYGIDVEVGPEGEYCGTLFVKGQEVHEWNGNMWTGVDPELARAIAFGWRRLPN